jgi:YegS/Rv2252/BmrU family lipid kinase
VKPLLVVNPNSAGGKTGKTFPALRSAVEASLGDIEVAMTTHGGHGTELARQGAEAGHQLVIAVGGDGTINEVMNGLMLASKKAQLGVIGQGTGGDFRKALGIEHRLDKYVDAIKSGRVRRLDVGKMSRADGASRYFMNILSAGMGGLVDQYVATASRAFGGTAAYFFSSVRALVNIKRGRLSCKVTCDGATSEKNLEALLIAICNGRYFGSGMMVAPMAEIDDGTLEVVAMAAPSKLGFAMGASRRIYSGTHLELPTTTHFRCQKIELSLTNDDAKDVFLVDLDGEPQGQLPISIEVVPGAIELRA